MFNGWQLIFRLRNDQLLARTREEWCVIGRSLLEGGAGGNLFAAGSADTHAHSALFCTRAEAGAAARRTVNALRQRMDFPSPFERTRILPVTDIWHAQNLVDYALGQAAKAGPSVDPTLEGSSLLDTLGLRLVSPELPTLVSRALPRLDIPGLRSHLFDQGRWLEQRLPMPLPPDWLQLLPIAIAAGAGHPDLTTSTRWARVAHLRPLQQAAAHFARSAVPSRAIAPLIGVSPSTVQRMLHSNPTRRAALAIAGQLKLHHALAERSRAPWPVQPETGAPGQRLR